MALVAIGTDVGLDASTGMVGPQIPDLVAGEDLFAGAAVYIKTADGKVYLSNGTAANEAAEFVGLIPVSAKAGQPVTVFGVGTRFRYAGSGLGPGDKYFVAATVGRLDTAATIGGTVAVVRAISDTDVMIISAGT